MFIRLMIEIVLISIISVVTMIVISPLIHRNDLYGAGKIRSQGREEEELTHGLHAGTAGEVVAELPLWQQVREERGDAGRVAARSGDETAVTCLVGQAESRAGGIVDIRFVEGEELAVACETVDDPNVAPVKSDGERLDLVEASLHQRLDRGSYPWSSSRSSA